MMMKIAPKTVNRSWYPGLKESLSTTMKIQLTKV